MNTKYPALPSIGLLIRMTRPGFLSITAVACLLGCATAIAGGAEFDAGKAAATLLLALVAHAAANVINDYHDSVNGADAANDSGIHPFTGGSRLIQQGVVSADHTRYYALALLALLVPAGLLLAAQTGAGLLLLGLAGMALAWTYSAPPFKLMSRGVGEVAVALAWWLIVIGADYVQSLDFGHDAAAAGISLALLMANILLANGFPDAASDAAVGKRTLVVRLGYRRAPIAYLLLALLAHGWLALAVALGLLEWRSLWALATLPLSLAAAQQLRRHASDPSRLRPALVLTVVAALLHGLAMAAGITASVLG